MPSKSPAITPVFLPLRPVPWHVLALLTLAVAALYGHTLNVPWYFDDHDAILNNPWVHDPGRAVSGLLRPRGVAFFSFAVNYHFVGQDVAGYHLTNIGIHLLCACLVYRLLCRIFTAGSSWALCGALLFLAHPLQTQAVTYVVQRMTLLATFFFLLAVELFLCWRQEIAAAAAGGARRARLYYAGALLAGVLAVFAKENAAVLPLALILVVRCLDRHDRRWRPLLLAAAPFLLAPLALAAATLYALQTGGAEWGSVTGLAGSAGTPWHYLVTQFSVLWIYLRLLLLPYGQTLDYGYPLATTLWTLPSLLAFAGLLALVWLGWALRQRIPAVTLGLGWFFLALAVESSIIPLDPLFEHRLYLAMPGFVVAVLGGARCLPPRWPVTGALLLMLGVCAVLTWQRNALWNDPLAFSADNVAKAPHNDRAFFNLAARTINSGDFPGGVALLRESLQRFPASSPAYLQLAELARRDGRLDEGIAILRLALERCPDKALIYNNLGFFYGLQQQPELVLDSLHKAIAADPHFADSYFNAARVLVANNRLAEAEEMFRRGFAESRHNPAAYVDFGRLLERQGRRGEAREAFRAALRLAPDNPAAQAGMAANR